MINKIADRLYEIRGYGHNHMSIDPETGCSIPTIELLRREVKEHFQLMQAVNSEWDLR